jgi:hypothetical protein
MSPWNEKVSWYGLREVRLDLSEAAAEFSLFMRPPQFSLML